MPGTPRKESSPKRRRRSLSQIKLDSPEVGFVKRYYNDHGELLVTPVRGVVVCTSLTTRETGAPPPPDSSSDDEEPMVTNAKWKVGMKKDTYACKIFKAYMEPVR